MMTELSLNVLDVVENSTRAKATLIEVDIHADTAQDQLTIVIKDNGCGMDEKQLATVTDPFFTTRSTRKVGLGVPFFKYAAESTGGSFTIESEKNVGTTVKAVFGLSHIDRMPLGDMVSTMHTLVCCHPDTDFVYHYTYNDRSFTMDTREFREVLGGVALNEPEVSDYIKDYLKENTFETDNGAIY